MCLLDCKHLGATSEFGWFWQFFYSKYTCSISYAAKPQRVCKSNQTTLVLGALTPTHQVRHPKQFVPLQSTQEMDFHDTHFPGIQQAATLNSEYITVWYPQNQRSFPMIFFESMVDIQLNWSTHPKKKDFDTLTPHHICSFNFKLPPKSMPGWQENTWKQWSSDRVRLGFTSVERHFCWTNLVQENN